ncbi:signal-induced proliferation-associated 1-like protein 2 isoform X1 [Stegostoma tigrinum]|uniref:signal-induced proliferation-associated 1-like protein 2 isoform X1 n=1 Tax=Stegostoma tigrinum TaxID=3053191 RepID=UPI00202B6753|nr:signal-induced proliferation-associated 1-like protein 2 isoform X1 [Stegostoma tigrinum]XP_048381037.1 signal-induced proliferation-associated 1-like protein 2 isoform X1 [Stegostoma tigrinum]XP_048381038.1 signal-induced proliferation-associated 1-like protein 2 isoform X1 [Stegostoma tigrinum]XP_048381039.1 signal-induced proliferation-associated 1-like protein 2 isoform X1 [Stegostoma tigrinum]XP_048381040.1 signal-induced proliferation-associated 1-like protein 2 isoform X1 [Stegostoma 
MQSDDFFYRKFKRNNPRPLLSAVSFEPKAPRSTPEPAGTTVRARISEWPPRRESLEDGAARNHGCEEKGASRPLDEAAGPKGIAKELAAKMTAQGRNPVIQRSNSEVTITDSSCGQGSDQQVVHTCTGAALHRDYGSASSIERQQLRDGEGDANRTGSEVGSAARFRDPYLLLGLRESPGAEERAAKGRPNLTAEPPAEAAVFRKLKTQRSDPESPRSPPPVSALVPGPNDTCPPWTSAKNVVHYDVQSILFDLHQAVSNRDSTGRPKNIITGASAASQLPAQPTSPSNSGSIEELHQLPAKWVAPAAAGAGTGGDLGDAEDTQLVLSCPHFRNEVGGEVEPRNASQCPNAAVSVLEEPRESYLARQGTAAYFIEHADLGANYYRKYFSGKEHQNFFGTDETLGPVAVSLRREEKDKDAGSSSQYYYRIIIRTTELRTLRASILEESFPSSIRHGTQRGIPPKKLLEYVVPGLNVQCLRLASNSPKVPEMLLKLDEQGLSFQRKVGIMYCKAGQSTEEEMYNNETAGPAFDEFLDLLGQRVKLKGFEKYRAQLDNKTDSTGTHSLYTTYQEYEIMFHVSTMLPYTANNSQQLLRKRHIGNDIVTIVFQEPRAGPFTPKTIRSHFQHVFLVVQVHDPCTDDVSYSVAVTRSKDIPEFGPFFQKGVTFPKSANFRDFLLAKVVNAENAAEKSEKFHAMATRTRQEYLKDLADNYVTTATLDSSSSKLAAIISLPTKKKEKLKLNRAPEMHSAGALVWSVTARLTHTPEEAECVLGISNEFVVLLDQKLRVVVWNCSCRDVIGWTLSPGTIIIYYERGEFVMIKTLESQPDDITEIVQRLEVVTTGCETEDLVLLRNSVHHLGFQTNGEGIVTQVEKKGYADLKGLKLYSRLVRICDIPVVSLSYKERAEYLRKANSVRITVIPPDSKGKPRMSFSELYRKSIEETERKGERVTDTGLGSPCLRILRMSSLQETRNTSSEGDQCLTMRSCSLEKTSAQSQRTKEDADFSSLKASPPDLILAANSQHLLPSGNLEPDAGDTQAATLQNSFSGTNSAGISSSSSSDPDLQDSQQAHLTESMLSSSPAGANQNLPSCLELADTATSDNSNTEWQSLADIASYCDSLVQSLSLEDESTAEPSRADNRVDFTEAGRSSQSPTGLNEKVVHLEAIVKQLNEKLIKEQEDKALLETEVEQLRQNNQRLHLESQTTVCHLLKVTELLCRTAPKPS